MSIVVPAVLPSSYADLEEKLAFFARLPSVERIQIDVVDGTFAEPPSWPFVAPHELREMVARGELLPHLDCIAYEIDLMCAHAEQIAGDWLSLGATRLTFHAESTTNLPRLLATARGCYGGGGGFVSSLISFGVALNIASDLALIEQVLDEVEYVQFMGIARIGRQGQPFDRRVFEKVRVFHKRHPQVPIQVDGGISLASASELVPLGVSTLVVGSALLQAEDPAKAFSAFENLQSSYGV